MIQPVPETRQSSAADQRCRLGEHRVIDVDGADADAFLQGQFCNDVAALQPGRAQINGYCTPKGRLLASFVLLRRADGFRLLLPDAEVAEAFAKRLGMFIMRAAVALRPRPELAVLGLFGHQAAADGASGAGLPEQPGERLTATQAGDATLLRWHDDPMADSRFFGVVIAEQAADLPDGEQRWRLADIRAGLPSVRAATREAFVPQMLNFREIDAVSFKKGCYPGQEIVARMHYLGKQKRHMRRFVAAGPLIDADLPVPGQALGDAGLAEVVDAVRTDSGVELLAVVRVGASQHGLPLRAAGTAASETASDGPMAHDAELPYPPNEPQEEDSTAGTVPLAEVTATAPDAGR